MNVTAVAAPPPAGGAPPAWLRADVPLTLLLDLACLEEPGYPTILGQALAREGVTAEPLPVV